MSIKRVILANRSRLLREMLQRVINKADHLKVVQEILELKDLPSAIERFDPAWVIASLPANINNADAWIETCMAQYPDVRFILLSPDNRSIKMRGQASAEEDLASLLLKDFIHVLERDLQHT